MFGSSQHLNALYFGRVFPSLFCIILTKQKNKGQAIFYKKYQDFAVYLIRTSSLTNYDIKDDYWIFTQRSQQFRISLTILQLNSQCSAGISLPTDHTKDLNIHQANKIVGFQKEAFLLASFLIIEDYQQNMFLKRLKQLLQPFDMFCSSQLLRYNSNTEYKTLTGGLISFLIIISMIIVFTSMVSNTLNKSIINSKMITFKQSDPPLSVLSTNQGGMFMFAVGIRSVDFRYEVNLSQSQRFFDVKLKALSFNNGRPTQTIIQLQQCTKDHWSTIPGFDQSFNRFQGSNWLCLQGNIYSQKNSLLIMQVHSCRNQTINDTCASSQQIANLFEKYGSFSLTFNYVNPVINTNQQEYISYYVQANDYVVFSQSISSQAWLKFSDYQITSDSSIWPVTDIQVKKGCIVQNKAINHPYTPSNNNTAYATVFLAKSQSTLIYNRQMQKITAIISYVGGLIGAITILMFFLKTYTDISLEVTIGLNLFEKSDEEGDQDVSFNFLSFLGLAIYKVLKSLGWQGNWSFISKLENLKSEAVKQLDVQILLRRLIKLQTCMTLIFQEQEITKIKQKDLITIRNAKKMRSLFLPSDLSDSHQNPHQEIKQSSLAENASHMASSISMHNSQILTDKLSPSFIQEHQKRIRSMKNHNNHQQRTKHPDREKTVFGLICEQEASKLGQANIRPLCLKQIRAKNRIVPIIQERPS